MLPDNLSPEDLLADESFISYCKKTSQADIEKWQRYAGQNHQQQLQVEAARKLFTDLFAVLASEDLVEQESILKRKLLAADSSSAVSINESSEIRQRPAFFSRFKAGYAAAVLLVIT